MTKKERFISFLLVVIYIVGLLGIGLPLHPDFVQLTPLNLLVSVLLLLWNHPVWQPKAIAVLAFIFLFGFLAEAHGTNYGLIFGNYQYGNVMGWQLWKTPLSAGLLWLIVTYGVGILMNHVAHAWHFLAKAAFGAFLLVWLDSWIEPVAIKLDFWQWENNTIPLQNYIGWYIIGFIELAVFHYFFPFMKNTIGLVLLLLQFLFFMVLTVLFA
jgi:bisanhydrobacterioruberin hydratase